MPTTISQEACEQGVSVDLPVRFDIEWILDENADLSFMGEYNHKLGDFAIDREERGDMLRMEYRYFHMAYVDDHLKSWRTSSRSEQLSHILKAMPKEWKQKRFEIDDWAELIVRWYVEQAYERMENYNKMFWHMEGCVVTAALGSLEAQTSVWGIESDSDNAYKRLIEEEQKVEALEELQKKLIARAEVE